jgi:palmitoyl-protein thioesterase
MDLNEKVLTEAFSDFFGPERKLWKVEQQVMFPEL